MFKLKSPCKNCPFRVSVAPTFGLPRERIEGIVEAPAFQCHKTVDYRRFLPRPGDLMALLHRAGHPNQIMQVGERLGYFNPRELDIEDTFASIEQAIEAHRC